MDVRIGSVLAATVALFVVGAVWYMPVLEPCGARYTTSTSAQRPSKRSCKKHAAMAHCPVLARRRDGIFLGVFH